jgi:YHS domain-containing protein
MKRISIACFLLLGLTATAPTADAPAKKTSREALQAFNDLVGSWRGLGSPEGSRADKQAGSWKETINCEWKFAKDDASLVLKFDKGKHWTEGQLRYLPDTNRYQLTLSTEDKQTLRFDGTLEERVLTLDRTDDTKKESQRFTLRLLHENRFLYQYEVKRDGKPSFVRLYQVGATKEGMPVASKESGGPECIVSGGQAKIKVMYKGQTYYVCCSGCKDAFLENPEKYIKEFEAKKKAGEK